ncbi:putative ammonium transporter 1 [Diaphorina citri]|uniref:Ammonium transporter 1 n=1 Tax=Diaphorina citri TaxID=121845 RepID=A0A3Q0IPB2_DIACI|nr:putative ammonium transporter 1 [Diaphorina citri]
MNRTSVAVTTLSPSSLSGEEISGSVEEELAVLRQNVNDVFLLSNGIIVAQSHFSSVICCIFYWGIGYSLAYSPGNQFLGLSHWGGVGVTGDQMSHWFFQFIFAATAATILSGAVAERCNFIAYIVYSAVISETSDFFSFGFQLVGVGALLLVVGFLAFNGGSLGHMTARGDGALIASVMSNTVMGGAGGSIGILIASRLGLCGRPCWNFLFTVNAGLMGMVSVCAGANVFSMWSSLVIGLIAGPLYVALRYLVIACGVDDPLDASAVHFGGGLWGVMSEPLFRRGGLIYGITDDAVKGLLHNAVGAGSIFLWSLTTSFILFGFLYLINMLRVPSTEEIEGLDITKHNEIAYPPSAWNNFHAKHMLPNDHIMIDVLNHNTDARVKVMPEYDNHAMDNRRL